MGKFDQKDNRGPPPPPDFCKNYLIFAKISFLRLGWTYWKLVRGPIGNRFVDLLETGSWTYWKPVRGRGPIGNRFVGAKYFYLTKPKIEIPLLTEIAH